HVIVVPKAVFLHAVQLSPAIAEHMSIVHHRQDKQLSLVERSVMYRALALFDQEHGWSREEHFEPGQVIVAEGDPPSAVYVVRSGSVKRSRLEDGEEVILSMLHEGHTFGGLAVLEDRPHTAAAIAVSAVELVTFDRKQFLQATAATPELHEYLGAVKRVYAMTDGLATLFDGYSGQTFVIVGENPGPQRTRIVETRIVDPDRCGEGLISQPNAGCVVGSAFRPVVGRL
ncbi:MAG: cyclic nucleotide-binding domain-containing protein, partial [Nitrospinae bacterium]|nr:cyclic nucleotide-binding domain-containing protein [Nitrospinota bacterium]